MAYRRSEQTFILEVIEDSITENFGQKVLYARIVYPRNF